MNNPKPSRAQLYAAAVQTMLEYWHQAFAMLATSQDAYNDNWSAYAEWAEDEADSARRWARTAKRLRG